MRSFVYSDAGSHKFWSIDLRGRSFTVAWGKVGTAGQKLTKSFPDEEKARKEADRLVREKTAKGYVETTAPAGPAVPAGATLREAMEAAILSNFDDRASFAVYADWLSEQDDPADTALGEFMQAQLALEDGSLSAADRRKLHAREKALAKQHLEEWAGEWTARARYTGPEGRGQLDMPEPRPVRFVRGLPAEAYIGEMTVGCAQAFVRSPQTRFLRTLALGGFSYEADETAEAGWEDLGEPEDAAEQIFLGWPHAGGLRSFQFGWVSDEQYGDFCHFQCHLDGRQVHGLIRGAPQLEELRLFAHGVDCHRVFALPLPRLRVLQVYHTWEYPLEKLAKNASLTNVTHLLFHPHAYEGEVALTLEGLKAVARSPHLKSLTHLRLRLTVFGDAGVKEIIASGLIERLKMLDLRHGRVTDAGAKLLAACPAVRRLALLDLSRNELTAEGIAALTATGVPLDVSYQHGSTAGEEEFEMEYLSEGDYE